MLCGITNLAAAARTAVLGADGVEMLELPTTMKASVLERVGVIKLDERPVPTCPGR